MELCPVYILLGPEKGLKGDFIKKIKDSLGGCEVSRFYAFEDYESEFFAQLENKDLFAERRLVILDEAQEIKTKDRANPIVRYIKNPSETVTLLILSSELYINADIMAAIPDQKNGIVKFYELFENRKGEWISAYFGRNGMRISREACDAIVERVDNNLQEFENVCSQMVIYIGTVIGKKEVTYSDVEEFLTHTRHETEFTLFAYIAEKRLESALECLHAILNSADAGTVSAVLASRLSVYFRRLYSVRMSLQEGMSVDDALKNRYFSTDRAITMPKDKAIYKAALSNYTIEDIQTILILLAEYDIRIKETGTTLQQILLEKCVVDIIKSHNHKVKSQLQN